jgi:single-strand DNA-binding protein
MQETVVTVIGALGGDPELRFTPSGAAVCNFSVGTNARTFDKQANEWKDGPTTWYNCSAWRELAENVAESLQKGMRVIVHGSLVNRPYETREGEKRYSLDLTVDAIGPELRFATAKVTRATRYNNDGGQQQQRQQQGGGQQQRQSPGPQADPWATPQGGQADPWANGNDDPPF